MPELPEVETIRRDLAAAVQGLTIMSVDVLDARVVRGIGAADLARRLTGRVISGVGRRGKALILELNGPCLVVQPMMTGQLVALPSGDSAAQGRDTCVVFTLSKGWRLFYNDQRRFGRLELVGAAHDHGYVRAAGPEPLEPGFTPAVLAALLRGRRTPVKTLLLDHRVVAGIGNIYACEALFRAGISPCRRAALLTRREVERLHGAIVAVLTEAVRMRGTSVRNYRDGSGREGGYQKIILVYGREGQPCRQCGRPVVRIVQAQRSTFYCPRCQRQG